MPPKPQNQSKLTGFFKKIVADDNDEKPRETKRPREEIDDIWDSPAKTVTPAKRKKIVFSSDEEDENQRPSTPQPQRFQSSTATPKSSQRKVERLFTSFIHSFRYDEQEFLKDSMSSAGSTPKFTPISSKASTPLATPSKTPKKTPSKVNWKDKEGEEDMLHLTFDFLKPDKIRDKNKNMPTDPDYDPRTLLVPKAFFDKQTPGHQQWWKFKADYFDTVLFFKVGKFYEMYHMDAVIGVENLGLAYMRGKYAHCGFPEMAFGNFADRLIYKGFKVARIEQTETPAQLAERGKAQGKKEKVVRRELCQITSQATKIYDGPTESNAGRTACNYLLSICEKKNIEDGPTKTRFGVAFVDCTIGQFYICEFVDDGSFSTLRTLLAHNQPSQVLIPRRGITPLPRAVINSILGPVAVEELVKKEEFLTAEETLRQLLDTDYNFGSNIREWPEALSNTVADLDEPIPKPKSGQELALSSLGAICWYLKKCLIDVDLLTMKKFETYIPATILPENSLNADRWKGRRMILDGFALHSLHFLPPTDILSKTKSNFASPDPESLKFSLFNTVDHCSSAFGKRLLRTWVCAPSCDNEILLGRQAAVKYLISPEAKSLMEIGIETLKKTPDLEKLFQRIHSIGLKHRKEKHPDSRAQIFDLVRYNSKKVKDLCCTLGGLEQLQKLIKFFIKHFQKEDDCPELLKSCFGDSSDMEADLAHFNQLLGNREKVAKEGKIIPAPGLDPEYDDSIKVVKEAEKELTTYLEGQQKIFKSRKVTYTGNGKNRYQLEIPDELTNGLSRDYELKSKRKGFKRYRTDELEELIEKLAKVEKLRDAINEDSTRRVFADFDDRKNKWAKILNQIAHFDCLLSLARYASQSSLTMCTPEFNFTSPEPYLEITQGYHPMLGSGSGTLTSNSAEYIPNDTMLGGKLGQPVLLLTGANMGGKSTLMRQTATLVVLAQIGSLVPATSMRLTPVDRIFARIGASDCLAAGQSTFFMELNETNIILRESSLHSLIIIDELGRGTSTFDGQAIATAVLKNLIEKVKCRTLFSTHYHNLCKKFVNTPGVTLGHMACLVENDDLNGDPSMDNITFLYTLETGPSPRSYGFYTARIAGIQTEMVKRAYQASKLLENSGENALQKLRELSLAVKQGQISDQELMSAVGAN